MILDPDKARERLDSPDNLANRLRKFREGYKKQLDIVEVEKSEDVENGGTPVAVVESRLKGKLLPRLPDEAKEEIKEKLASGLFKGKDLAKEYGVAGPAITRIKQEAAREWHERERAHESTLPAVDQAVKDRAIEKMMMAMGLITEEKLEKLKVKDLASVSSNMAKVLGVVAPKNPNQAPLVNLVVYSPEVRDEKTYRVVEIGTNEAR